MGSFGSTPKDQDGIPISAAWSETNNAMLPIRGAHEHTDVNNNTSVAVSMGAGVGDFIAGSIADLASLLALAGSSADAQTVASIMGRLTKIVNLLSGTLAVSGSITASNPSVSTSGAAAPNSATMIGGFDGTNLQALKVDGSQNLKTLESNSAGIKSDLDTLAGIVSASKAAIKAGAGDITDLATLAGAISSSKYQAAIASIAASLAQANQLPVSNAAPQNKLSISGSLVANTDNSLTFGATARRIRIQNESSTAIYWECDTTASAGSPALAAPGTNSVSVEWIAVQCAVLHVFVPTGGTTTLNGSGGVKVTAWA